VPDTPCEGQHWAERGIPTAAEADDFAADTILLSGEGECDKGDTVEVNKANCMCLIVALSNPELHIGEMERPCIRCQCTLQVGAERKRRVPSCRQLHARLGYLLYMPLP